MTDSADIVSLEAEEIRLLANLLEELANKDLDTDQALPGISALGRIIARKAELIDKHSTIGPDPIAWTG